MPPLNPRAMPFVPSIPPFVELYGDLQAIKTYHTLLSHTLCTANDGTSRGIARQAIRTLHASTARAVHELRQAALLSAGRR